MRFEAVDPNAPADQQSNDLLAGLGPEYFHWGSGTEIDLGVLMAKALVRFRAAGKEPAPYFITDAEIFEQLCAQADRGPTPISEEEWVQMALRLEELETVLEASGRKRLETLQINSINSATEWNALQRKDWESRPSIIDRSGSTAKYRGIEIRIV